MSIMQILMSIIAFLSLTKNTYAGCLEPQKLLDEGVFVIESCGFHSTTNAVYEDPRLNPPKGIDIKKNPMAAVGISKTKGKPRILLLQKANQGILLKGKINGQTSQTTAFLRTNDRKYCEKFIKNNVVEVVIHEMCCDCMNSCSEAPCAIGTNNEITKLRVIP